MKRRLRFRYRPSSAGAQAFHVEVKTGHFGRWRYVETLFIRPPDDIESTFAELVDRYRDGYRRETEVEL